jgi:hypothetical protein
MFFLLRAVFPFPFSGTFVAMYIICIGMMFNYMNFYPHLKWWQKQVSRLLLLLEVLYNFSF